MSEERLERIETQLGELKTDVAELKTDVAELKTDVAELKTDVAELKTDVAGLKTDVADLKTGDMTLHAAIKDLGDQMRTLHEQTLDSIKALAPDFEPLRREFRAADAALAEALDRRIVPLEAYVRSQSPRADRD